MKKTGNNLSELDLHEFESKFQIHLPNDYKEFMLRSNGGIPVDGWIFNYVEDGDSNRSVIRDFLVIYKEESKVNVYDDLARAYIAIQNEQSAPQNYLPIATDPGGNIIFLNAGKDKNGEVYFGNHEWEDDETGYIFMSLIANSFSEFINNCYTDE